MRLNNKHFQGKILKIFASLIILLVALVIVPTYADPAVKDSNFVVEKYVTGICCSPTTMAFEGNDILVLSKVSGEVHLFRNGFLQDKPILVKNVTSVGEQGMLGITTSGKKVYLYFTVHQKWEDCHLENVSIAMTGMEIT